MIHCEACQRRVTDCACTLWCCECGCRTNHTTAEHYAAASDDPDIYDDGREWHNDNVPVEDCRCWLCTDARRNLFP